MCSSFRSRGYSFSVYNSETILFKFPDDKAKVLSVDLLVECSSNFRLGCRWTNGETLHYIIIDIVFQIQVSSTREILFCSVTMSLSFQFKICTFKCPSNWFTTCRLRRRRCCYCYCCCCRCQACGDWWWWWWLLLLLTHCWLLMTRIVDAWSWCFFTWKGNYHAVS